MIRTLLSLKKDEMSAREKKKCVQGGGVGCLHNSAEKHLSMMASLSERNPLFDSSLLVLPKLFSDSEETAANRHRERERMARVSEGRDTEDTGGAFA